MERGRESKYILIYLAALLCKSLGGAMVRYSLLPPCGTAFYRMLFSIPLLLPFVWRELPGLSRRDWLRLTLAGLLMGANLWMWNFSLISTTQANVNLLANIHIFLTIPLSWLLFKERPARTFLIGAAVAVVGVVLLTLGKSSPSTQSLLGDGAAFLSAMFYGGYLLMVYELRDRVSSALVLFGSAWGCLLFLFPLMWLREGLMFPATWPELWPLLAIILIGQFGGVGLVGFCLGKLRASLASTLSLCQPGVGALLGLVMFNERITWLEIVAIIVVSVGVYIAQKKQVISNSENN